MPASARRWRAGNVKIGVVGDMGDLRYDYEYAGRRPGDAGFGIADGSHDFAPRC